MKLKVKLYTKQNCYTIYEGNKEMCVGKINGQNVKEIIESMVTFQTLNQKITSISLENSYSYGITIYEVEVK